MFLYNVRCRISVLQFDTVKTLFICSYICLLYTSDAADERSSVDLGGRRIIKKKKEIELIRWEDTKDKHYLNKQNSNKYNKTRK